MVVLHTVVRAQILHPVLSFGVVELNVHLVVPSLNLLQACVLLLDHLGVVAAQIDLTRVVCLLETLGVSKWTASWVFIVSGVHLILYVVGIRPSTIFVGQRQVLPGLG